MYGLFEDYTVKGPFCLPFLIEWLEIKATLMQAIPCMVYITKKS